MPGYKKTGRQSTNQLVDNDSDAEKDRDNDSNDDYETDFSGGRDGNEELVGKDDDDDEPRL